MVTSNWTLDRVSREVTAAYAAGVMCRSTTDAAETDDDELPSLTTDTGRSPNTSIYACTHQRLNCA